MTMLSSKAIPLRHQDQHLRCRLTAKGLCKANSISSTLLQGQRNNQSMEGYIVNLPKISTSRARGSQCRDRLRININGNTQLKVSFSIVQRILSQLLRKVTTPVVSRNLSIASLKRGPRANMSGAGLAQCSRLNSRMGHHNSIRTRPRFRMPLYHIIKEYLKGRSHQFHHCSIAKA